MAKWVLRQKSGDFMEIARKHHIHPILAKIIRNRGVEDDSALEKYLHGTLKDCYEPKLMKNMEKAVDLVKQCIGEQKKIRVIGDYDADGISATYILLRGLRTLGADVDYEIPHRIHDGYGLNENLISRAKEDGRQVIITCDNGIAARDQVAYAKSLGMLVIVTDHHDIPFEETEQGKQYVLPEADVVVNPKQPGDIYPNSGICGAVVAYKLVQLLCPENEALLNELLQVAAIATVCDVMELLDENRIIVKEGLKRISTTNHVGLKALLMANGLYGEKITAYHIGFVIGPCINATGRLDVADRALELLLCQDEREATLLASELKDLNDSRKYMTEQNVTRAIENLGGYVEEKVLVVYLPDCHESLAGIIAGRIKERYGRPTIVLTKAEEGLKGSGRSIPQYHMQEALTHVAHLLTKFGGHAMAAGLSLPEENLEALRQELNNRCLLTPEEMEKKIVIDVPLSHGQCTKALIQEMDILEPFGNGNSKPVFAQTGIRIKSEKIMGKNQNVGKYMVQDKDGCTYEMIYFGDFQAFRECYQQASAVKLIFYPSINVYRGQESIQYVIQEYAPCE